MNTQNNAQVVPLTEQIACVERELKLRENVYKKLVAVEPEIRPKLVKEYRAMRAVLASLRELESVNRTAQLFNID